MATPPSALSDAAGQLLWDIAASTPNSTGYFAVFRADQVLNTRIHPHEPSGTPAVPCSAPRESTASGSPPTESSICTAGRRGEPLGEARHDRQAERRTGCRKIYRLTLSEDGVIRVHDGEPLYRETRDDPTVLRDKPGHIYRVRLDQDERKTDDERDPYSGLH